MKINKIKSNAKLNLALNITGKKKVLHKIESIIGFIDLHDVISINQHNGKKHHISFYGKFSKNIGKKFRCKVTDEKWSFFCSYFLDFSLPCLFSFCWYQEIKFLLFIKPLYPSFLIINFLQFILFLITLKFIWSIQHAALEVSSIRQFSRCYFRINSTKNILCSCFYYTWIIRPNCRPGTDGKVEYGRGVGGRISPNWLNLGAARAFKRSQW